MDHEKDETKIKQNLASYIDHTLLKEEATKEDIEKLCREAIEYNFKSVCIYSKDLEIVTKLLEGKKTIPIAVVDFPKGGASPEEKAKQTKNAISKVAKEIDMVIDYNAIKHKDYKTAFSGIKAVVDASDSIPVKVILETSALNHNQIIIACALAKAVGAAFVKTSTGFGLSGATVENVKLMKEIVGDDMLVKASGGIRTQKDAIKMIKAGASRLGTSTSVKIIKGDDSSSQGY